MNSLAMSELLLNELVFSQCDRIRFHVNNKSKVIECNDSKVKNILDLILKAGMLPFVKNQLIELVHKDNSSEYQLGKLKFLIDNIQTDLIIKEMKSGLDFTWEVIHNINC